MKKLLLLIIILFSVSHSFAQEEQLSEKEKARREKNIQAGNPFKRFGYKPKIATLSKGKYLEFHDLDSIVRIGSFTYNVKRKALIGYTKLDTVHPESTLRPEIISRWFSPDPLSDEFPSWSPYNFVKNNPIRFIDPDGRSAEDIVDKNGNKLDIRIVNNQLVYGNNVGQDVRNILNSMWKTETGQGQVAHLLKTKSQVYVNVSEKVGAVLYKGKYYGAYELTGPSENQSKKLIKDYDGGKVYEESTLTLFKGTYEYGKGNTDVLKDGNVSISTLEGKDVTNSVNGGIKLEPSQNPSLIYQTTTEFYNLSAVHGTEHTKSANIKLQRKNKDAETPAYNIENKSRKELKDY